MFLQCASMSHIRVHQAVSVPARSLGAPLSYYVLLGEASLDLEAQSEVLAHHLDPLGQVGQSVAAALDLRWKVALVLVLTCGIALCVRLVRPPLARLAAIFLTRSAMASGLESTPAKASVATPDFLKPVLPANLASPAVKDFGTPEVDSLHSVTRVSVADDPLSMFAAPTPMYERAGQCVTV